MPLLRNSIFLKNSKIEADPAFKAAVDRLFSTAAEFEGRSIEMLSAVFGFLHCQQQNIGGAQLRTVSERTWQKAEQLKPALEYIEQHYGQHISLETLAKLTGFSPKYFCRYFRTIVHRSPIDYLNYYRIECAAQFLAAADMNVAEVAVHCGFSDSSAFIKQFRKYKGTTPRQYRIHMQDVGKA
jgi:AraC-like DNA-binding protein